ncbi:MAG: hypothetical protein V2I33_17325 [Kangiellaceae bacterium]|nr:hypothetical protein [Kangiellaceae bacterium]
MTRLAGYFFSKYGQWSKMQCTLGRKIEICIIMAIIFVERLLAPIKVEKAL